ncbi:hypothetical protein D3C83_194380 [compost metagenome]
MATGALNTPGTPTVLSLRATGCGAESVPRKKQERPEVAALRSASRSSRRLITGMQYI